MPQLLLGALRLTISSLLVVQAPKQAVNAARYIPVFEIPLKSPAAQVSLEKGARRKGEGFNGVNEKGSAQFNLSCVGSIYGA